MIIATLLWRPGFALATTEITATTQATTTITAGDDAAEQHQRL